MKSHTILRTIGTTVVCVCAIATWWWKTHPDPPVRTKTEIHVVQIRQGDGYLSEKQCRSLHRGQKAEELRNKFGIPAGPDNYDDYFWSYPLREDHSRHCQVDISNWYGPLRKGYRVDSTSLELAVQD